MLNKEKRYIYKDHYVCRGDLDKLNEIDNKLGSLRDRMESSVDMLNNEDLDENYKRQLSRFLNSTYPNSKQALEEKRAIILEKYKHMPKTITYNFKKRLISVILVIVLLFISLFVIKSVEHQKSEQRKFSRAVYVSQSSMTYHFDDYCVKLSSLDKNNKITLKVAVIRD